MKFELFVALRYLFTLRKNNFISVISLFAVCGVALGVAALIVVIGVMNGFSTDLRDKILGVNAHVIVTAYDGTLENYHHMTDRIEKIPGVTGVTPFIYSEVMLSSSGGVKGVVLRGVDAETAKGVLSLPGDMLSGSVDSLSKDGKLPEIVIGNQLARRLGLVLGDTVNLLSPSGTRTAAGFTPKVRVFKVGGIFRTGMYEYDSSLAYISNTSAQKLLGFKRDFVSGLEIRLADVYAVDNIGKLLDRELAGYPVQIRNWQEMNSNLFAALKLEKTAMFIILAMIVMVGSFSIITTLVMLVMQKTKDIAVLMSMGATSGSIRRIFMLQGTLIGLIGTTIGYLIGIPVALLLKKYQFIKLPSNVYPVDYLPIRMDWMDLTIIGVAAFSLCFLATLYPAKQAAALEPAQALRYE
ncbi:lipoprotein-releasing ABC transporter permease subunit [Maridesulfovibrio salexigens]|uniref:Lipoprotein releasing system, transmembrane protein, LolC/E family n=1 Tax=Maridesulfovibrio salexigens (strain ATCC 14822 / DSM 2638 / NCIMB 8403 / VKM B-1763) TaxID=526222 RepID=C6BY52_MARSD|nr:lipoprotein-releasing ABC transporter permease subunit [Maridesulfovibrio salexigens]ACS80582.1 lipoprotein releasing system, transmembrane protein, LolC/E family [Maridesulfovibrio salexigens DSM 2638]